jgi:hypothetical protein
VNDAEPSFRITNALLRASSAVPFPMTNNASGAEKAVADVSESNPRDTVST